MAILKGARIMVVLADVGTGKNYFRSNNQQKTGSGNIGALFQ